MTEVTRRTRREFDPLEPAAEAALEALQQLGHRRERLHTELTSAIAAAKRAGLPRKSIEQALGVGWRTLAREVRRA